MLNSLQRAPLIICMLYLLHLDDLFFPQNLDGIEATIVPRLDKVHTAKAAGAKGALQRKVIERILALGLALEGLRLLFGLLVNLPITGCFFTFPIGLWLFSRGFGRPIPASSGV